MCNRTFYKYMSIVVLFYVFGIVVSIGSIAVAKLGF